MNRCIKTVLMTVTLFPLGSLGSMQVCAQPLGLMSQQTQAQPQYKLLSSPSGRFVFGQISDSGKDQFMLDTFTGRLWRIAETGRIGIFLKSVPYLTSKGEYGDLPGDISKPETKEPKKQ